MTTQLAHQALRDRFDSMVRDVLGIVAIHDNDGTTEPSSGLRARVKVVDSESAQSQVGPEFRTTGAMQAEFKDDVRTGMAALDAAGQLTKVSFRADEVTFAGGKIVFLAPSIENIGVVSGSFQVNVFCPYWYEEVGS